MSVDVKDPGTMNVVSISGGKDSTALLLLAIEREVEFKAVFADTGHEHPKTYNYVHYLEKTLNVPIQWVRADFTQWFADRRVRLMELWSKERRVTRADGYVSVSPPVDPARIARALELLQPTSIPFLDLCMVKGRFPSTKVRFCSEELKHNPIFAQVQEPLLAQFDDVVSWQGVRAEESPARAKLPEWDEDRNHTGLWNYRPILQWTIEDVFAQHRKHGIEPNPLYREGMGRVGCMPCIHARKDELREIASRFPEEIERVAEWERLVSEVSRRGGATFFATSDGNGDNIHEVVMWSKTSKGKKNLDMFFMTDMGKTCSSLYGLCE
jgi:3'-phosphoadenosine 5'-phosphosulfate sulfotransferase (PAPS reductase)/FAD synthetase